MIISCFFLFCCNFALKIFRFENEWIRDNNGQCVFFTENDTGGAMKPIKMMRPMKSMKQMKPMRPMDSLSWSELSGEQFFET